MALVLAEDKNGFNLNAAALTDRGQRRKLNEDAVFQHTGETLDDRNVGLYLVCDGLGGHQAGEVASQLAIETITDQLKEILFPGETSLNRDDSRLSSPPLQQCIQIAITQANNRIRQYAQTHPREAAKLGTTITLALIYGHLAYIANVGDSRTYLYRSGQVTQITRDHSFAAELARKGAIDESEIPNHPRRNVLYRSLGLHDLDFEVDLFERELQPGDKLLLCSDGLWQAFPDPADLAWWLGLAESPADLCRRLVLEANRRDGSDNISAVVVSVEANPDRPTKFSTSMSGVFREVALVH